MNEEKKIGLKENLQIDDLNKVAGGSAWEMVSLMQCDACLYCGKLQGHVSGCMDCPNCGSKGTYKVVFYR